MSDTPRTDEMFSLSHPYETPHSKLARIRIQIERLERELNDAKELLYEAYSGTVNSTCYPDGPNMDRALRMKICNFLKPIPELPKEETK